MLAALFLICCGILGLTRRSENAVIFYYKQNQKSKVSLYSNFAFLILILFNAYLAHQTLKVLLIIGGIELNPGPSSKLEQDNDDRFYECNPSYFAPHCSSLCEIKHKCEFPGCTDEIFASCHCDMCKGYGPLVCFKHFKDDMCPLSISDAPKIGADTGTHYCNAEDVVCSRCFMLFSLESINLTPSIWAQTKSVRENILYL